MSLPRMQPRHPGPYRVPIAFVLITVTALKQRLLVPPDKGRHHGPREYAVRQHPRVEKDERLPEDRGLRLAALVP